MAYVRGDSRREFALPDVVDGNAAPQPFYIGNNIPPHVGRGDVAVKKYNWIKVAAVAESLLKYETLTADDVDNILNGKSLSKPTISDLLNAEAAKESQDTPVSKQAEQDPGPEPGPGAMPSPA